MARQPYRVEVDYPQKKSPRYFLVRDVRVGDKKTKVKRYLYSGLNPPTAEDIKRFRKLYSYDLELKAAKKAGKLGINLYKNQFLNCEYIDTIEEIRYLYKRFTDFLTVNEIEIYEKQFESRYIQGTTAIEGNTFSIGETEDLLEYGIIPKTKTLREINEIQNFKHVKSFRDSYKGKIDLDFIRHLHAIIMHNIDESAGIFRRIDIGIGGCDIATCPPPMIESELKKIIKHYYKRIDEGYHPFEEAIMFHYFFEICHPFTNGNGRVGREILNYMLFRGRYPKLLFLGKDRDTLYIQALKMGNTDEYTKMATVFADIIIHQRLDILRERLKIRIEEPLPTGQLTLTSFVTE